MSANLENSIVATGLDKVSFHSNPKGGQCQRLFQLLYNCTHHMIQQFYIQNPSSYVKSVTAFTFSPSICHEVMGLGAMTQFFECSVSSQLFHSPLFYLHQETVQFLFMFCYQSGIICISEAVNVFPAVFIKTCDSSSPVFCMMYSSYKLNKQGDNIQL